MRAKNELKQLSEAYQNVLNEDSGSYSDIIKRQAAERTEKSRKDAMQHQGSRNQGKLNLPWNSGRYESDEEVVNGNEIDLNADPSAQKVQKKAIPLQFRVTDRPETIETLEGSVEAPTGAYIMTGTKGENWPIPGDKFDATYDIIDAWGDGGKASKKAIPVPAKQMQEDFFVTVSWSPDKLKGKPGDWLVQYGPGDYGVVEAAIFDETYDRLEKEEPGGDGRQLGWGAAIKKAHPLFYK